MASLFATQGSQVFIGQTMEQQSDDFVLGDFAGQSWVSIGWLESIGEFGDESAEIPFEPIGEGRVRKLKGIRNAGNMDLVMGIVDDDPGQILLLAAEASIADFAFKVEFNNAPPAGTPAERYFIGKVMTARERLETVNSVARRGGRVAINSNVVRVNSAP